MNKLASQMLDKAQEFIKENPELIRNTLLAGGIGALGGALVTGPSTDEDEPAGDRVRRRLRNALLGAAITGTGAALLTNAGKNINSAKLVVQKTPEEKVTEVLQDIPKAMVHPGTLAGAAGLSATTGLIADAKSRHNLAASYLKAIGLMKEVSDDSAGPMSEAAKSVASKNLRNRISDSWDNDLEEIYKRVGGRDHFIKQLDMAGADGRAALLKRVDALNQGAQLERAKAVALSTNDTNALNAVTNELEKLNKSMGWSDKMKFADELKALDKAIPGASSANTRLNSWQKGLRGAQKLLRQYPKTALLSTLIPAGIATTGLALLPENSEA
jgi:hypothetical protein